jgi:hypothetical protein
MREERIYRRLWDSVKKGPKQTIRKEEKVRKRYKENLREGIRALKMVRRSQKSQEMILKELEGVYNRARAEAEREAQRKIETLLREAKIVAQQHSRNLDLVRQIREAAVWLKEVRHDEKQRKEAMDRLQKILQGI